MAQLSANDGRSSAAAWLESARWGGKHFHGEWTAAGATICVREPATGTVLGEVGESRPDDLPSVVARAREAQAGWAAKTAEERAAIFRRAAAIFEANRRELTDLVIRETGGLRGKAEVEVQGSIEELFHSAALLVQPEGHILPSRHPERLSLARRVPLGV